MRVSNEDSRFYKIVHLDLKGLPPTPKRLCNLPEMFASFGLDGVLIEWEDTFPYRHFPEMKADYTYSVKTVKEFLKQAQKNGLLVIPLVQTFGHLESLLKLDKYKHLREIKDSPSDLCPLHPQAQTIISQLIDDVIELHQPFGLKYFHLGADEVWSLGNCRKCKEYVAKAGKEALYLHHMAPLFDQVNRAGVRAIIWHDMLRNLSVSQMRKLAGKVDLMFWGYSDDEDHLKRFVGLDNIRRCNSIGIGCWSAGAYKGADGPVNLLPNVHRRVGNTLLWKKLINKYKFQGHIFTGWSRYQTLHPPCDPLEASWESLALCTKAFDTLKFNPKRDIKYVRHKLYGTSNPENGCKKNQHLWRIYSAAENLKKCIEDFDSDIKDLEIYLPLPDGRMHPKALRDWIQARRLSIRKLDSIAKEVKASMRGFVPTKEIDYFLQSKISPRNKLLECIIDNVSPTIAEAKS